MEMYRIYILVPRMYSDYLRLIPYTVYTGFQDREDTFQTETEAAEKVKGLVKNGLKETATILKVYE